MRYSVTRMMNWAKIYKKNDNQARVFGYRNAQRRSGGVKRCKRAKRRHKQLEG